MSINRRQFIKSTAVIGGGLIIGFELAGCGDKTLAPAVTTDSFHPNSFLEITPNGDIILQINRAEMGQGVYTGMTTLVAEELEVDPATIKLVGAPSHPDFIDPTLHMQLTGGSMAVKNSYEPLRKVGATAKAVLLTAAAQDWSVPVSTLIAENGKVRDPVSQREVPYSALIATAKTLPIPKTVLLKSPEQFKLIGKYDRRLDSQQKIDGSGIFGIDLSEHNLGREGMVYAVLVRCPHFGGKLKTFDAGASEKISGVSSIFAFNGNSVAIIANGYWPARKAANALKVEWDKGPLVGVDSTALLALLRQQLDNNAGHKTTDEGTAPTNTADMQIIEAEYFAPYQAHATMEPLNCVADVRKDRIDIWTGNQSVDMFRAAVADTLKYAREQVFIHSPLLGGGFGRRGYADYAVEAALLSQRVGKPVKLQWSREDDMQHDFYRPLSLSRFRAHLQNGKLVGWQHKITCPSVLHGILPMFAQTILPPWTPRAPMRMLSDFVATRDMPATEGAAVLPYAIPYFRVDYVQYDPGVPVGSWRSVGNSINAFFVEGFLDEIAHALQQDPLAYRLALLKPEQERVRNALQLVAEKAQWGHAPAGHFQGIAVHEAFETIVAQIAEISVESNNIKVHKVTCAVDCGRVVNPDIVKMQMESGIIFALSAALKSEITIEDGAVKQNNFDNFEMIRMNEAPEIDVHIVESDAAPTGVGEPGVPPLAPALGNAIFAATGKRLRALPFRLEMVS